MPTTLVSPAKSVSPVVIIVVGFATSIHISETKIMFKVAKLMLVNIRFA